MSLSFVGREDSGCIGGADNLNCTCFLKFNLHIFILFFIFYYFFIINFFKARCPGDDKNAGVFICFSYSIIFLLLI